MRRPTLRLVLLLAVTLGVVGFAGTAAAQLQINEIRIDNAGADTDEYFELKGTPGTSLNGYTYIVIGDASSTLCGTIESVTPLDGYSIQADGYFCALKSGDVPALTGYDASLTMNFENSDNVTHMLVAGFTGLNGDDLDTNDDGVLDVTPWTSIVDWVSLTTGAAVNCAGGSEYTYAPTVVGPDGSFVPGQVYRCSDTNVWMVGDFTLGVTDTPGATNVGCLNPPPDVIGQLRTPCVPAPAQSVTAQATVLYATGADLHYTVNGGSETVAAMNPVSSSGDTTVFEAVIPGQPSNGNVVRYFVNAYNANPDTTAGFDRGYLVGTVNIGDIQVNDVDGANIYRYLGARVRGNVTVPYGLYQTANTDYYIQDSTGGINVFQFGTHTVQPGLGDDITVEGTLDQYNGKLEITSGSGCDTLLVDINGPGAVPDPVEITSCDDFETRESQLVKMRIAKLPAGTDTLLAPGSGANYYISNCYPDSVIMRIDSDTNIGGTPATSQYIDVVGIASQFDSSLPYDSGYQIIPRYASDITFLASTGVGDVPERPIARLLQNAPNPFARTTQITYQVPAGARAGDLSPVKLTIYDLQGRVVTTLVDGFESAGEHTVTLDTAKMGRVRNGIYFYRLETGNKVLTRKMLLMQ